MEMEMEKRSVKLWGVMVVLMVAMLAQHGTAAGAGIYACWGGCYNDCILRNGKTLSEKFPCYLQCSRNCVSHSASVYQDYCLLGCSLELCNRFASDGQTLERCMGNCTNICKT
ncbi:hypothetical protein F0562_012428 [Nyssa sinensis]|uniref:Knottin scorpion toxin-like domain-containing protein n=1 Tax=Nyssa sinensis TaxID=561372 RepID=A0A5J4ZSN6_9ASTE|nr:hypothetical protein F0562_012428 [Nyssa sinensis]